MSRVLRLILAGLAGFLLCTAVLLMVYAPGPEGTIDNSRWFSKAKAIDRLYHGRPVRGGVRATVVNGKVVYRDGQITGEPGDGRFVRPTKQVG